MNHPNIIKNAMSVKHESERKVMDGIVKGSFNNFQMNATKGLLSNAGMPAPKQPAGNKASVMKAGGQAPKTVRKDGFIPYQGASFSK
jgi:hypothetical protein